MHAKITTTITTLIDLDSFKPNHKVGIEAEEGLPVGVIKAAVVGACKSTIGSIENTTLEEEDEEDWDATS